MTLSRPTRSATRVLAFAAACVAASCAGTAFATGQADALQAGAVPAEVRAPGAAADGAAPVAAGHGPRGDRGRGDGPGPGFGGSRPGAPGLALSEAQQDQVFAITHAAAPQQRNQDKAERKAIETLHALGAAPQFDAARAGAAARALGQAVADGALLQARLASQVLAVLTPEQREQLRMRRPPGQHERAERP